MVNGISDKAQKGKTATSVSSNAAAAGTFPLSHLHDHKDILISGCRLMTLHANTAVILKAPNISTHVESILCSANHICVTMLDLDTSLFVAITQGAWDCH